MKTTLTIILFGLLTSINAQNFIRVSNNAGAVPDYTNLQTAIDNAPAGATIYIEPSKTSYGTITINKRLTLFGGGYDALKHNGKSVSVSSITLNKTNGDATGTFISGIFFGSSLSSASSGVDSITIQRCYLNGLTISGSSSDSASGWKIINCKIYSRIAASRAKNILIANNIIYTLISGFTEYSIFFTNNIFIYPNTNALSNTNFTNNIFYASVPSSADNCIFSNNLTRSGYSVIDCENNSCLNNIEEVAVDDIFVDFPSDLHLKPTCPGVGAGADGNDIGIYGGLYPFPDEDYGASGFPEINDLIISNSVVEPNGILKVNLRSKIMD